MSSCNNDCSSCGSNCASRREPQDLTFKLHEKSKVKKVIGIVSGKGGVGKSMTTSLMAVGTRRAGYNVGILDADITGPSIPKGFGLVDQLYGTAEQLIVPARTRTGIQVVSINLLLDSETTPVIWRGPVLGNVIKQFWSETLWQDVDYMFVDMPPGTGDVPLTVFQSLPLDGIIIVASPQELVGMIVGKAVNMAKMMNVPILGLVENMSYLQCPDCGKKISVFGESHIDEIGAQYQLPVLAKLPIDPKLAEACDGGKLEELVEIYVDRIVALVSSLG